MKVLVVSDPSHLAELVSQAIASQGHVVLGITGQYPLEHGGIPDCDAVIVEDRTWTRYVVLYRYFNVLDDLVNRPMAVAGLRRSGSRVKGRLRPPEAILSPGYSPSEVLEVIRKLEQVVPRN